MPTPRELDDQPRLGDNLAHHGAIYRGEYCAACDDLLSSPPPDAGYRLCPTCWPAELGMFHPLRVHINSFVTPWCLCFVERVQDPDVPGVAYWLLPDTLEECLAILDKSLCCRADREDFQRHLDTFGHASVSIFCRPAQYAALLRATAADPCSGYEKGQQRASRRSR